MSRVCVDTDTQNENEVNTEESGRTLTLCAKATVLPHNRGDGNNGDVIHSIRQLLAKPWGLFLV